MAAPVACACSSKFFLLVQANSASRGPPSSVTAQKHENEAEEEEKDEGALARGSQEATKAESTVPAWASRFLRRLNTADGGRTIRNFLHMSLSTPGGLGSGARTALLQNCMPEDRN